ncbi:hypothetical protein ACOIDJ_32285, partial [Klebsiella pneumoniae]|uniref:P-type ATPase n=1 Tax=Klebsiella pneumoniae TaxID=573 RepID=UPI003015F3E4
DNKEADEGGRGGSGNADDEKNEQANNEQEQGATNSYRSRPLVATDQSAITGESLAVDKYIGDVVYYTTGCKRGKAYALVTATAKKSFVG